eukprot:TRINITY_DN3604_c0_g1_i1.p1 TRINITY_DN3604_c0_g1~~TRINITY_DN3604_c0_g1_i1.p1  ORF type:complete len:141 (+),score=18.31 TRINITY_DN3604_c0_g1_i1:39-425(+)
MATCLVFQILRVSTFSNQPTYSAVTVHPDFFFLPTNGMHSFWLIARGGESPEFYFSDFSRNGRSMSQEHTPVCTVELQHQLQQGAGHPVLQLQDASSFNWIMGQQLSLTDKKLLQQLLSKYRECFASI